MSHTTTSEPADCGMKFIIPAIIAPFILVASIVALAIVLLKLT